MAAKIFLTICIQIVFIQIISCQIFGNGFNSANINPGLIDGSLSAIDINFGPNEMALNSMGVNEMNNGPRVAANEMAYGNRVAANEMAYGPRMAANEMAYGPRMAANEMAYGPRISANEMTYGSRMAANEMAYGPRIAANEMAYGPKIAANEMAYGSRMAANEMAYGPRMAANEMAYGSRMAANEMAVANELASANMVANGIALDGLPSAGFGPSMAFRVPSSGGSFPVTCSSPIAPTGITIVSENTIEGILAVNGELPVLAAVSLQGSLPTSGSGSITYGCGNGAIGMVNEGVGPVAAELAYEQRLASEMDLARLGRVGCGSGVF